MTTDMEHERRVIDANHAYAMFFVNQCRYLKIRLAESRGQKIGLADRFKLGELEERYPEFKDL